MDDIRRCLSQKTRIFESRRAREACPECYHTIREVNCVPTCSRCGLTFGHQLDSSITSFSHWIDYIQPYARQKRFQSLLHETNGTGAVPQEVLRLIDGLMGKRVFSHNEVRQLCIRAGGICQRYQHKCCSILASLGRGFHRTLSQADIKQCCKIFGMLDKRISERSGIKVSFTLLLPTVLCVFRRVDKLPCCKPVSTLICTKYLANVLTALRSLGSELYDVEGGITRLSYFLSRETTE